MYWPFEKKTKYRPRFIGYYYVVGIVFILNGILNIIASPFGYMSTISVDFSLWNLKKDSKRWKENRTFIQNEMRKRIEAKQIG
jgi:hypothetical protein